MSLILNTFIVQSKERGQPNIILSLTPPIKNRVGLGRLVVVASVDETHRHLKQKTQIFISQLLKFYQDLPEILGLTPKKIKEEGDNLNLFEKTMERANFLAPQTFSAEEMAGVKIIIACLLEKGLQFANHGSVTSHLLYEEKGQKKILNLADEYNQPAETEQGFFNNLVSGNVGNDNFLILSVGEIFDYLSINRLRKLLSESGAEEACIFLEKTLSQLNNNSFGGVICSWPARIRAPKSVALREFRLLSDSAIKKLIQQKGLNKFESKIKQLGAKIISILKTIYIYLKRIPPASLASFRNLKNRLVALGKAIGAWLTKRNRPAPDLFANYRDSNSPTLLQRVKDSAGYLKNSKKIWMGASLAVILILGLVFNKYNNQKRLASAKDNQLAKEIQSSLDEAESNLIYKNEVRAATVLTQAKHLLGQLPKNYADNQATFDKLSQDISVLDDKLSHKQTVVPQVVNGLPPDLRLVADDKSRVNYGKYTYTLDESGRQILKNNAPWLKETLPAEIKIISFAIDSSIYLALSNGQIWKFTRGHRELFEIKGLFPAIDSPVKIFTAADWADLYILEPQAQRLMAVNKTKQQLTLQYSAKEFADLKDLTVKDKKIYILNDSKILSFEE